MSRLWALTVALAAFGGVPVALVAVSRWRLGSGSPLAGMDPPWTWSRRGLSRWWSSLGDGLDTSDQLVDLFVRVGLVVAWSCLAVLAIVVVAELVYQARHGMPSPARRSLLGLGRLGRWIAAGLLAIVPLAGARAVTATGLHGPTVPVVQPRIGPVVQRAADAPPAPSGPSTHVVRRGESVWSIAEQYAPRGEADEMASEITRLNLGRVMNDGHRFVTAALIEPGWELLLPEGVHPATPPPPAPVVLVASAPPTPTPPGHLVTAGESYWSIAEDHLDSQAGHEVSEREILNYVPTLMAFNVPRLGYDDPAMLHPGDTVMFGDAPAEAATADAPPPDSGSAARDTGIIAGPSVAPATVSPDTMAPTTMPPTTTPPTTVPPTTDPPVTLAPLSVPATAAQRDTVPAFVPPASSDSAPSMVPIGLGGAGLVAAGAIAVVESRRRARLRRAVVGERLAGPANQQAAGTEQRLRAAGDSERIARLDLALRAVAGDLADQQAQVRAALLADSGEVTLLLDVAATPVARFWRADTGRKAWIAPAGVALDVLAAEARRSAQPCPALAHLGTSIEGDLFVDLEAFGLIAVEQSPDLVRAIAASVALSPLAEPVQFVTVGLDEVAELDPVRSAMCERLDDAVVLAAAHVEHLAPLASNATTFRLRARRVATGSNEPVVVISRGQPVDADLAGRLRALTTPAGRGVAVVVDGIVDGAAARIRPVDEGVWRLDPVGIEFTALHLSSADVDQIAEVIADAEPTLVVTSDETPAVVEAADRAAPVPGEWTFLVRILGPVSVEDDHGSTVAFERSKALELVVWLTQHRQHSGRGQARAALWDVDVRDATFANVVSDARRSLARVAATPDGAEWVGRGAGDRLPLHEQVVTDAEVLAGALSDPGGPRTPAAVDALHQALGLVRGMPFAETAYLWPDGEGITSALILLVTNAAVELASVYLDRGDIDGVFWATQQGLLALPGHEELVALRMRAHAQRGDRAGVRQEWEAYQRALRADTWSAADPSPKVVALRKELLAPAPAHP